MGIVKLANALDTTESHFTAVFMKANSVYLTFLVILELALNVIYVEVLYHLKKIQFNKKISSTCNIYIICLIDFFDIFNLYKLFMTQGIR